MKGFIGTLYFQIAGETGNWLHFTAFFCSPQISLIASAQKQKQQLEHIPSSEVWTPAQQDY